MREREKDECTYWLVSAIRDVAFHTPGSSSVTLVSEL
jgi:hypothetical protein